MVNDTKLLKFRYLIRRRHRRSHFHYNDGIIITKSSYSFQLESDSPLLPKDSVVHKVELLIVRSCVYEYGYCT